LAFRGTGVDPAIFGLDQGGKESEREDESDHKRVKGTKGFAPHWWALVVSGR
jgi:hypothetical protein